MPAPRTPPPPTHDIFEIMGVDYYVQWRKLPVHGSFFLPTTATRAQVNRVLAPIAAALDYTLEIHTRVEYERYGVRVWRLR